MRKEYQLQMTFPTQELRTEYIQQHDYLRNIIFEDIPEEDWDEIQFRVPRDRAIFLDWTDSEGIVWDSENMK